MSQKLAIFANPIAGRGRARILAQRLAERGRARGWDCSVIFDHPAQADPGLDDELTAGISIGGDGTLRAVVQRLTRDGSTEGPGIAMVPMGTANLMGLHLGIQWEPEQIEAHIVEAIERRRVRRLDLSRVVHPDQAGPGSAGQVFLLMVGVGIDGEIVHALDRARRGPISFASYVMPSLGALAGYDFPAIEVAVDGKVVWPMAPAIAFAGNIAEYGWGFPLLAHARSDDGVLDVCVLPASSPMDLIRHTMAAVCAEHLHGEGVVYVKGRDVRIRSEKPVAVQADGDPAGFTPVDAQLLATRVAFIVP